MAMCHLFLTVLQIGQAKVLARAEAGNRSRNEGLLWKKSGVKLSGSQDSITVINLNSFALAS